MIARGIKRVWEETVSMASSVVDWIGTGKCRKRRRFEIAFPPPRFPVIKALNPQELQEIRTEILRCWEHSSEGKAMVLGRLIAEYAIGPVFKTYIKNIPIRRVPVSSKKCDGRSFSMRFGFTRDSAGSQNLEIVELDGKGGWLYSMDRNVLMRAHWDPTSISATTGRRVLAFGEFYTALEGQEFVVPSRDFQTLYTLCRFHNVSHPSVLFVSKIDATCLQKVRSYDTVCYALIRHGRSSNRLFALFHGHRLFVIHLEEEGELELVRGSDGGVFTYLLLGAIPDTDLVVGGFHMIGHTFVELGVMDTITGMQRFIRTKPNTNTRCVYSAEANALILTDDGHLPLPKLHITTLPSPSVLFSRW